MRKALAVFLLLLSSGIIWAKGPVRGGGDFGIGLIVGEPTGISWKAWSGRERAWDGALAWSFSDDYLRLHADYLWHDHKIISVEKGQMPLYFGVGGTVWSGHRDNYDKHFNLGVRGVIGLEYIFPEAPVDIFLELAPTMGLLPETGFDIQGGLGARIFF